MKALKEKRVSLRSLWRKSLVIFCILALAFVFASCNTDDNGNDIGGNGNGGTPTPTPPVEVRDPIAVEIAVRSALVINRAGYEGMAPDISGIQVDVRFDDGKVETIDAADLSVYPPIFHQRHTTIHQEHFLLSSASGTVAFTLPLIPVRVFHSTNPGRWAEVYFPVVLALNENNTTLGITGAAVDQVVISGTLSTQDFFEDDLDIEAFPGITATGNYQGLPLRSGIDPVNFTQIDTNWRMPTQPNGAIGAAIVSGHPLFVAPLTNAAGTSVRAAGAFAWTDRPGGAHVIPLTADHLREPFGAAFDRTTREINLRFSEVVAPRNQAQYDKAIPFQNMFTVMAVELARVDEWPDIFENNPPVDDVGWINVFEEAGMRLTVHYSGTTQTREIGMFEFRRAMNTTQGSGNANPRAGLVALPDLSNAADDPETVFARLHYYGGENQSSQGGVWFPNQVLDLVIPVWTFSGDIVWERKDYRVNPEPLQWYYNNSAATTPVAFMQAVFFTYNLVAYFERGTETPRGFILNDYFVHGDRNPHVLDEDGNWEEDNGTGVLRSLFIGEGAGQLYGRRWFSDDAAGLTANISTAQITFANATSEPIEKEIRFRIPGANSTSPDDDDVAAFFSGFARFGGATGTVIDGFEIWVLPDDR